MKISVKFKVIKYSCVPRVKKILEQLSRTRFFPGFEISRSFLRAEQVRKKGGKIRGLESCPNIFFPLDIEYFLYSILSKKAFVALFVPFFKSSVIDIEYSMISHVIGQNQYQYFFQYFFCRQYKIYLFKVWNAKMKLDFLLDATIFRKIGLSKLVTDYHFE